MVQRGDWTGRQLAPAAQLPPAAALQNAHKAAAIQLPARRVHSLQCDGKLAAPEARTWSGGAACRRPPQPRAPLLPPPPRRRRCAAAAAPARHPRLPLLPQQPAAPQARRPAAAAPPAAGQQGRLTAVAAGCCAQACSSTNGYGKHIATNQRTQDGRGEEKKERCSQSGWEKP